MSGRLVQIWLRSSRIFIQAYGRTEGFGLQILCGPVAESSLSDPHLGELVHSTFQYAIDGIKHPSKDAWPFVTAPPHAAAGVKSNGEFRRTCKSIMIEENDDDYTMTPSFRGDQPMEKVRTCKRDPVELLSKIKECFNDAEFL